MKYLVVGGNSGIGEAIAARLWNISEPFAQGPFVPKQEELDVRDEDQALEYIRGHGPFTHIVYTVGKARLAWSEDLSLADYVEDFTVNAFGFGILLGLHRTYFPNSNFSAVALVSDAMRNPMRGSTTYCASKAALAAIIKNLAREWAPHCRVNGIAPAIVADTPMTEFIDDAVPGFRGWDPEKAAAYEKSLLPMGRRVTKYEVAQLTTDVLFGPDYLTGSIIDITGGK